MIIEDGGGKSPDATTSNNGRLNVSSRSAGRIYYESRDEEQAYIVVIPDAAAVAGEETAYIQNISADKDMVIDSIHIGSLAATKWKIKFVTGTPTGDDVTPTNLNKSSTKTADAVVKGGPGGVTGLTDAGDIKIVRVPAEDETEWDSHEGLRLSQNAAIAIENLISGDGEVTIDFHYDSL